jgi:hypothetical protein
MHECDKGVNAICLVEPSFNELTIKACARGVVGSPTSLKVDHAFCIPRTREQVSGPTEKVVNRSVITPGIHEKLDQAEQHSGLRIGPSSARFSCSQKIFHNRIEKVAATEKTCQLMCTP